MSRSLETISPALSTEDRENAALPRSAERQPPVAVEHLERAENAEVERARQVANVPRRAVSPLTAAWKRLASVSAHDPRDPSIERRMG